MSQTSKQSFAAPPELQVSIKEVSDLYSHLKILDNTFSRSNGRISHFSVRCSVSGKLYTIIHSDHPDMVQKNLLDKLIVIDPLSPLYKFAHNPEILNHSIAPIVMSDIVYYKSVKGLNSSKNMILTEALHFPLSVLIDQRRMDSRMYHESEIVYIALEMLKAVKFLHDHGLYHGSLDNDSFFMTVDHKYKLCDFLTSAFANHQTLALKRRYHRTNGVTTDDGVPIPSDDTDLGTPDLHRAHDVFCIGLIILSLANLRNDLLLPDGKICSPNVIDQSKVSAKIILNNEFLGILENMLLEDAEYRLTANQVIFNLQKMTAKYPEFEPEVIIAALETKSKEQEENATVFYEKIATLADFGVLLENFEQSLEYCEMARQKSLELYGENSIEHMNAMCLLGRTQAYLGSPDDSIASFKKALEIVKQLPAGTNKPLQIAIINTLIGRTYGNAEKATKHYKNALEIFKSLQADNKEVKFLISEIYGELGSSEGGEGEDLNEDQVKNAIDWYLKSLNYLEEIFSPFHPLIAGVCENLGALYHKQNDMDNAIKYGDRCRKIRILLCGDRSPELCTPTYNLALSLREVGKKDEALKMQRQLMTALEEDEVEEDEEFMDLSFGLAYSFLDVKDLEEAKKYFIKGLELYYSLEGYSEDLVQETLNVGYAFEDEVQNYSLALEFHLRALALVENVVINDEEILLDLHDSIAFCQMETDQLEAAFISYQKANQLRESLHGLESVRYLEGLGNMGTLLKKMERYEEAIINLERAYEGHKTSDEEGLAEYMKDTAHELIECYEKLGRPEHQERRATLQKEFEEWKKKYDAEKEEDDWEDDD